MEQSQNRPDRRCKHCGTALTSETAGGLCPRCLLEMNFASRTMPGGGASPQVPPPSPEEMAERFPQFEILECLGRGGMGIVYKARQKSLDRLVAIKVLAGEMRDDPQFEARFSREARTLAKLSHPNIVTVHDFGESDGMFYLVMEFIDGVNLRDVLRDGCMEPVQALAIVPEICEALQFAHDHGVVHRDIKPENILMDRDGRVKIADFGIATLVGARAERSGTPPYMAPEQEAADGTIDHRTDIYALGVVFYEMLTGERPERDPSRPSQRVELDVRLDEVVLRALEKEPALRYQTAGEFRTVVETMAAPASPAGGAKSPTQWQRPGVDRRSRRSFFGLPLWHVATGIDPASGRPRTARGIVAIGDRALGVVAMGGFAFGGFAFGGVSIGLVSWGGVAVGLLAMGGVGIALLAAFAGLAVAPIALGGMACGWYAYGGQGFGIHLASATARDAEGMRFFGSWAAPLVIRLSILNVLLIPVFMLFSAGLPWWLRRRERAAQSFGSKAGPSVAGAMMVLTLVLALTVSVGITLVSQIPTIVSRLADPDGTAATSAPQAAVHLRSRETKFGATRLEWEIRPERPVIVMAGWYALENGRVVESQELGHAVEPSAKPLTLTLEHKWKPGQLELLIGYGSGTGVRGTREAPGNGGFSTMPKASDTLSSAEYVELWRGECLGSLEHDPTPTGVLRTFIFVARLLGSDEDPRRSSFGFDLAAGLLPGVREPQATNSTRSPQQVARDYLEAVYGGDVERALRMVGGLLGETPKELARNFLTHQVVRRESTQAPEPGEWHEDGLYAVTNLDLAAGIQAKAFMVLERLHGGWKVVGGGISRAGLSPAKNLETFKRFQSVDREDRDEVARAFIRAVRRGDFELAAMLALRPMSTYPETLGQQFSQADRNASAEGLASSFRWIEEKPYAVTRGAFLGDLSYLVLRRTEGIWRVVWADRTASVNSLADDLKRFKQEQMAAGIMVEDLALRFLVAIREKDEKTLRELCVDRNRVDWTDELVGQFSMELRERFRQQTGEEFTLYPDPRSVRIDKDLAVVACRAVREVQKKLGGNILVLHFCRTGSEWKVWTVRKAPESRPIEEHLKQARKWAAEWRDETTGDSGKLSPNTPELAAHLFMLNLRNDEIDNALAWMAPEMKAGEGARQKVKDLLKELREAYAGQLKRLTEFMEWYPKEHDANTRFLGTRVAGTSGQNVMGLKGGLYLILAPTSEGWKVVNFGVMHLEKSLSWYVDRIVRIVPGEGPEFRKETDGSPKAPFDVFANLKSHDNILRMRIERREQQRLVHWMDTGIKTLETKLLELTKGTEAEEGTHLWIRQHAQLREAARQGDWKRVEEVYSKLADKGYVQDLRRSLDAPVADLSSDSVTKVEALRVSPPAAMPEGSPLTVEQMQEILEKVTWGEFITTFADDGHEHEVSWKEVPAKGGNSLRFEVSFPFGGEKMLLDLEVDPEFRRAVPSRMRSAANPNQVMADASEFLPVMIMRYAVQSGHPAAAPATEKVMARARQARDLSTMRDLEPSAGKGVADSGQLFDALGMKEFMAQYGNGQRAMQEHHEQLPPVMRFAIAKGTADPSAVFVKYVRSAHLATDSKHKAQAILLLRILGIAPGDGND